MRTASYRDNLEVPSFDDSRALFVFDGVCVLCCGQGGSEECSSSTAIQPVRTVT
jgi:hypothetical protein